MNIIDAHCDTILNCFRDSNCRLADNEGHINIEKLKKGGAVAQFFALYISREEMKTMEPYDIYKGMYQTYKKEIEANGDEILTALCAADIEENKKAGRISAILAVEDGVIADGKIERIKEFYDDGVRLITLTWNFENSIGFPNSGDEKIHQKGLKPFGIEVVEEMNRLGMLIDVSHLSEGGFWDVKKYSKTPFIASHSCARALCNESRNLTDGQLKTIGETGSVAGVNFYSGFLKENSEYTSLEDIVRHTVYMADKAGIESVGLGSDFDGIENELEMVDYSGYPMLIDALSKKFTASEIDKITHENMMRLIKCVIK